MNLKTVSLFIFSILLSISAYAEVSIPCGLNDNGNVSNFDATICKEDIAFKSLYKVFPNIIKGNINPFFDFKDDPVKHLSSQENKLMFSNSEVLMRTIFEVVTSSLTILILIFVSFSIGSAFISTMQSGKFMGEKSSDGTSVSGKPFYYALAFVFLIAQFNGATVLQTLLVSAGVLSISIANLGYGAYLNYFDNNISGSSLAVGTDLAIYNFDENEGISKAYVKGMVDSQLCKIRSEQAMAANILSDLSDKNNLQLCAYTADSLRVKPLSFGEFEYDSDNIFFDEKTINTTATYELKKAYNSNFTTSIYTPSELVFGKDALPVDECGKSANSYSCGAMNIFVPNILSGRMRELFEISNFNATVNNTVSLMEGYQGEKLFNIVQNGWEEIVNKIVSSEAINKVVVDSESEYTPRINRETAKVTSLLLMNYHQIIMNARLAGYISVENGIGSDLPLTARTKDFYQLLLKSKSIANSMEEYNCVVNIENTVGTSRLVGDISSGGSENSSYCLRYSESSGYYVNGTQSGLFDNLQSMTKREREAIKYSVKTKIEQDIFQLTNSMIDDVSETRDIITSSYKNSLNSIQSETNLIEYRAKGFVLSGSIVLKMIKQYGLIKSIEGSLFDGIGFTAGNFNVFFISNDITTNLALFSEVDISNNIFKDIINNNNGSANRNLSSLISEAESIGGLNKSDGGFLQMMSDIKNALIMPVLLISNAYKDSNDCASSGNTCDAPKTHPMIALNQYGHEIIKAVLTVIAAFYTLEFTAYLYQDSIAQNVIDTISLFDPSKATMVIAGTINAATSMIITAGRMIMPILWLYLILGIVLAYVIPLIPFFKFIIGFLSWFLFLVSAVVLSFAWAVYLLQPSSDGGNPKAVSSLYKMFMIIILKPVLILVSLFISWSIFEIAMQFIHIQLPVIMGSIDAAADKTLYAALIDILIHSINYIMLVYIAIIVAFNTMDTLPNMVTNKLEIGTLQSNSGQISDKMSGKLKGANSSITSRASRVISGRVV